MTRPGDQRDGGDDAASPEKVWAPQLYRVRFSVAGAHVIFAKCGDFTVRRGSEFAGLLAAFSGAEFIGDDENIGIAAALENG